jgi:hypothetical protein
MTLHNPLTSSLSAGFLGMITAATNAASQTIVWETTALPPAQLTFGPIGPDDLVERDDEKDQAQAAGHNDNEGELDTC